MSLALALISGACLAGGYGQYQLERLVSLAPQQSNPRIDLDYLDLWLAALDPYARTPARPFGSESERQRVLADLRALESVVGLAVLEQGSAPLVRRSALLASIAYQLGLPGAGVRADLAFNRWLLLAPEEGDAHYHYGRFLLASAQYPTPSSTCAMPLPRGSWMPSCCSGLLCSNRGSGRKRRLICSTIGSPIRTILRSSRCCDNQLVTRRGSRQRPAAIPT